MSSSFVHAPSYSAGGSHVDAWLAAYWDQSVFSNTDAIATRDGTEHSVSECGVIFRNFRPVTGKPGAYFADPVAIVQYRPAMRASMGEGVHSGVHKDDVVVPLGTPDFSNPKTQVVLQQAARQWVSGGKNTADMSDEHIIPMYYAVLQQLVFLAGNATTVVEQARWFPALVALTRAFAAFHAAYEPARRVTEALVVTPGADDMLQKALAEGVFHASAEGAWSVASQLDLLAIAIRRNIRHGAMRPGMAPGPFAIFTLVPLLRDVVTQTPPPSAEVITERFNAQATQLLSSFLEDDAAARAGLDADGWTHVSRTAASAEHNYRVRTLVSLTRLMGKPLTGEQADKLLTHCATTDMSDEPKWVEWGVLPAPPALKTDVASQRYAVGGRPGATYRAKIVPVDEENFRVFSFKGVEWTGLTFKTPGTYIIHTHDLGIATTGRGDTRGRALTANWRVTAGTDVLPRQREGYSLAGEQHTRTPHGSWYYKACAPLTITTPVLVIVTATSVRVQQAGRLFFTMSKGGSEPVMFAFKNLWLSCHFKEPEPPVPAPAPVRREPTAFGTASSWAAVARTPAALIAQLRDRE